MQPTCPCLVRMEVNLVGGRMGSLHTRLDGKVPLVTVWVCWFSFNSTWVLLVARVATWLLAVSVWAGVAFLLLNEETRTWCIKSRGGFSLDSKACFFFEAGL